MPAWEFPGSLDTILIRRKNWIAVFASEFNSETLSQRITILIIYLYRLSHAILDHVLPRLHTLCIQLLGKRHAAERNPAA